QGAIESLAGETRAYRDAYGLSATDAHSVPLECAWSYLKARYVARAQAPEAERVLALVSLAALLDGDSRRAPAAAFPAGETKRDAWSKPAREAGCAALGSPSQVIATGAGIVASARASEINAAKSAAAQELLSNVRWYYALWAVT